MSNLVQVRSNTVASATTLALAYTSNVTANNLLIAIVGAGSGEAGGFVWSVTDSQSNVWTKAVGAGSIDDNSNINIFYAIASSSGACTVTAHLGTTGIIDLIIGEAAVINAILDQTNFGNESHATGNITTTKNVEIIVAASVGNAGGALGTWSATNSFVIEQAQNESGNSGIVLASLSVVATGTYSSTFSNTAGLGASAGTCIASFYAGAPPVGNTRYGVKTFLQPQPANSIPYRLCVNNNRLHCLLPDYTGIFSDFVYYLGRENNQGGYWYRYVIDPGALFSEEDGTLLGGFGDGGVGNLYTLDTSQVDTFAGSNINIVLIWPFSKNDINQRKDVYHLRLHIDTGGSPLNLTGFIEFGTSFSLGTITTSGLQEVNLLIQNTSFNLQRRMAIGLNGAVPFFKMTDWSIDYEARPEPISYLRIATNYQLAAKKRLRTIPIVIDTRGNAVNINVTFDGVAYGNQSFTTSDRTTVYYLMNTDIFATDIIINITATTGNVFEYYDAPAPVNVETLPVEKLFDQIGPVEFERNGELIEFRVRMLALTNTITYNVFMDDVLLVSAQPLPVTPNVDKTYGPIKIPKGIRGTVCRIEFLSSSGVFYRWNCKLKYNSGGTKSDTKQITVQDASTGLQR